MLKPEIGKLIRSYPNRYRLVVDVARRARKIAAQAEEQGEILLEKPVSLAIEQIARERNL